MSRGSVIRTLAVFVVAFAVAATAVSAQTGAKNGEWHTWGGDLGATRYAPLDQINADNFRNLEVAWRFTTEHLGRNPDFNLQATPLMVNGVLYFTAGAHRDAVALDARHRARCSGCIALTRARAKSPRVLSGRGVGYWTDGEGRRADLLRDHRLPAGRARRQDRPSPRRLRQKRHHRPQ